MTRDIPEASKLRLKQTARRVDEDRSAELLAMITEINELRMRLDLLLGKMSQASGSTANADPRRMQAVSILDRVRDKLLGLLEQPC